MNFRTDLEILALDPQVGGMTVIEARAADGSTVVLMVRVAEPLAVGGHMTLALTAEPTAAAQASGPSMRDRMQARLGAAAPTSAGTPPRLAITLNVPASGSAAQAGTSSAPSNPPAASAAPSPAQTQGAADASSLLLSSILGASPRGSASQERNVDDEMDALFGARRKG